VGGGPSSPDGVTPYLGGLYRLPSELAMYPGGIARPTSQLPAASVSWHQWHPMGFWQRACRVCPAGTSLGQLGAPSGPLSRPRVSA